jgi:hypothetical protein
MSLTIQLTRSSVPGKHPLPTDLGAGELALNFAGANPFLSIKDSAGVVRRLDRVEVSNVAPVNPTEGQLWYDRFSNPNFLRVFTGGTWVIAGSSNAAGPPLASAAVAGLVRLADAAAVVAGTPSRVVDAAQLKTVADAAAQADWAAPPGSPASILNKPDIPPAFVLLSATTSVMGGVTLASAANITAGSVGRVVDAAQLLAVRNAIPVVPPLAVATNSVLGGVKIGPRITVAGDGTISADVQAGRDTNLGFTAGTRVLTSSTGTGVTLPLFTAGAPGLVQQSGGGTTNFLRADGTWQPPPGGGGITTLPIASATVLGGVLIGAGITVDGNGRISAAPQAGTGTDLDWDAATRQVRSSTGADATLSLFNTTAAGLVPQGNVNTNQFLRADGAWGTLAAVAISGNYTDLTNRPAVGAALTPGAGLTGSAFTGATAQTWAVNSTAASIANTIVSRDASSNFSAAVITAAVFNGPLNGNANSATRLATARTINGQAFDGTANITLPPTPQALLTRGAFLTGANYDGTTPTTWAVNATAANTGGTVVSRDANGDFAARNITGSLLGNATSAGRVANALTINGTAFDGSAPVNLTVSSGMKLLGSGLISITRGTSGIPTVTLLNGSGLVASASGTTGQVVITLSSAPPADAVVIAADWTASTAPMTALTMAGTAITVGLSPAVAITGTFSFMVVTP